MMRSILSSRTCALIIGPPSTPSATTFLLSWLSHSYQPLHVRYLPHISGPQSAPQPPSRPSPPNLRPSSPSPFGQPLGTSWPIRLRTRRRAQQRQAADVFACLRATPMMDLAPAIIGNSLEWGGRKCQEQGKRAGWPARRTWLLGRKGEIVATER